MIENIWEGIYDSFEQCPGYGQGFKSDRWACQETERINKLLQTAKNDRIIPSVVSYRTNLLPFLAATTAANSKENKVTILDFGGGLGSTYISVTAACANQQAIDYHIIDSKNICQIGESCFKDDNKIHFYDHLPDEIQDVDIACLSSSIQYVQDWKSLLKELLNYDPQYILLADLPAGEIPTYATLQNYYESKIPHRFFNVGEVIETMLSMNLNLLFKSSHDGTYLGKERPMPQDNFPAEYQVGKSCNLLFSRKVK
jgi:putative methyltransferase (TIGR04325 family)